MDSEQLRSISGAKPDEATDEQLDSLFHALADTTRRDILRRSVRGEESVSQLAEVYPMSFAAVQKHIAVLERVGLVTKERRGRELLVRTEIASVEIARRALNRLEMTWRGRIDRMNALLALSLDLDESDDKEVGGK